jgi:hypothetical protein
VSQTIVKTCLWTLTVALVSSALGATSGPATELRERSTAISGNIESVPTEYRGGVSAALGRVDAAVRADRVYLALFELQRAFEMQSAFDFAARRTGITTSDAFLTEWKRIGAPPSPAAPPINLPIFVQALATSAEARGPATYRASLPYSEDSGISSGLFYLGKSTAVYEFASFCRKLDWPAVVPPPPLRSVDTELDVLDAEVAKAYGAADAAVRSAFINVNVTLKLARETDGGGHHAAALLQYLLARYRFAMISAPATAASSDLQRRLDSAQASLAGKKVDHSIAEMFLQIASTQMATETPGPRAAAVILDTVLPAYNSVVTR